MNQYHYSRLIIPIILLLALVIFSMLPLGTLLKEAKAQVPIITKITSAVDGNGAPVENGGTTTSNFIRFEFTTSSGIPPFKYLCTEIPSGSLETPCLSGVSFVNLQLGLNELLITTIDGRGVFSSPISFVWRIVSTQPPTLDTDHDGVPDAQDNCPTVANPDQRDFNHNGIGNACDTSAENTNNINNTATSAQNQEQSACAVAVTCPEGSTTVAPPATGTLEVSKVCDPGSITLCGSVNFAITVTGNKPHPRSFTLQNGQTQDVTVGPGRFTVTESFNPLLGPNFSGDCVRDPAPGSEDATGAISAGQTLHCTITNTQRTGG